MTKNSVRDYSETPSDNTDIGGEPIAGASTIRKGDDAIRTLAAHVSVYAMTGYLYGLTLSNNGSDAIDIAAGECAAQDTPYYRMSMAAALTKRLDASWAVGSGNGGLDTGSIANTTYHVWLIQRSDTGVVDALFSTSASSPTMPANYDRKRRIGSIIRASGAIVAFTQTDDLFLLSATRLDISNSSLGTTALLYALSVPTGLKVQALVRGYVGRAASAVNLLLTSPSESDQAPGSVTGNYTTYTLAAGATAPFNSQILTDTSAQIRARSSQASTDIVIATYGWIDRRGRDF